MDKLKQGDSGLFGDLRVLPNPDGLIFRSTGDPFAIAVEAVTTMKADVLSETEFRNHMDEFPVTAFAGNTIVDGLPAVVENKSYSDYLKEIGEVS